MTKQHEPADTADHPQLVASLQRRVAKLEAEREAAARMLRDDTAQVLAAVVLTLPVLEQFDDPNEFRAEIGILRQMVKDELTRVADLATVLAKRAVEL